MLHRYRFSRRLISAEGLPPTRIEPPQLSVALGLTEQAVRLAGEGSGVLDTDLSVPSIAHARVSQPPPLVFDDIIETLTARREAIFFALSVVAGEKAVVRQSLKSSLDSQS